MTTINLSDYEVAMSVTGLRILEEGIVAADNRDAIMLSLALSALADKLEATIDEERLAIMIEHIATQIESNLVTHQQN